MDRYGVFEDGGLNGEPLVFFVWDRVEHRPALSDRGHTWPTEGLAQSRANELNAREAA